MTVLESRWNWPKQRLNNLFFENKPYHYLFQVQLAAASGWLKQMLLEVGNSEENRIKTIILPFIQSKQMKQVDFYFEIQYYAIVML